MDVSILVPHSPNPLEYYNWNYLDQYICTRGEGDYGLMDVSILVPHSPNPLEYYNWNYLDQYICTRGEGDYGLMDVSILVTHSPPPPPPPPTFVLEIKENLNIPTKFKIYLLQAINLIWVYMACGRIAFG